MKFEYTLPILFDELNDSEKAREIRHAMGLLHDFFSTNPAVSPAEMAVALITLTGVSLGANVKPEYLNEVKMNYCEALIRYIDVGARHNMENSQASMSEMLATEPEPIIVSKEGKSNHD